MDDAKCKALKVELTAQREPLLVPVERYFDGNDDPDSIGCNLMEHPGIGVFRDTLTGIAHRHDVEAVYVQIAELDPGDGCWPYTDTVFVVGVLSSEELESILRPLEPSEVGPGEPYGIPRYITTHGTAPVLTVWWD